MQRSKQCQGEEYLKLNNQSRRVGNLLDGTECTILLDTGASKNSTSKNIYMSNKCLNLLPKFTLKCKSIQVGNSAFVSRLLTVPVIIEVQD